MKNKKNIIINNVTQKIFSYSLGGVSLNFTLRNDIKDDLKDFVELLRVALQDVSKEIEK